MNTTAMVGGRDAVEFAKNLFLEDRDFPATTAVQLIRENCGIELSVEEVGAIRERIVRNIDGALPGRITPVSPARFTNHPRLVSGKKIVMARKGRPQVDVQEKRQWLDEWLKTQARIPTIKEAQAALREHFGEALGTTFVATRLTEAHQEMVRARRQLIEAEKTTTAPVSSVPPPAPATAPLRDVVKILADLMRVNGIRKIAIDDEGRPTFEAFVA